MTAMLGSCAAVDISYTCETAPHGWEPAEFDAVYIDKLSELPYVKYSEKYGASKEVIWHSNTEKEKYWACIPGNTKTKCGETGALFSPDESDYVDQEGNFTLETIVVCG